MLELTLEKLGLSSKEAKVYLAALELGSASVQKIAQKAGLNRPNTYVLLDSLTKQGLATAFEEGKKTLFAATAPEQLKQILYENEEVLRRKKEELAEAMPQLKALFNLATNKPKVKFYEGFDGQITMREAAGLDKDKNIYSFVSLDDLLSAFPKYDQVQEKNRVDRSTMSHVIYTRAAGPQDEDPNFKREGRYIPKEKFPFSGSLTIHPVSHKVYISIYKNTVLGLVIEDKDISQMLFNMWQLAWEAAEKYNQA